MGSVSDEFEGLFGPNNLETGGLDERQIKEDEEALKEIERVEEREKEEIEFNSINIRELFGY